MNIEVGENCPIKAVGFNDLPDVGCDEKNVAIILMNAFVKEFEDIENACYKVKGVQW